MPKGAKVLNYIDGGREEVTYSMRSGLQVTKCFGASMGNVSTLTGVDTEGGLGGLAPRSGTGKADLG